MKHSVLIFLFVFLAGNSFAQNCADAESAIKDVIKKQETAWNIHDWDSFSSYFRNDGTLINFVGQHWKGKNKIVAHFKLLADCCLNPTSLTFEVKDTRFITPVVAIAVVEETLRADRDYDVPFRSYKKGDTDRKLITNLFVKESNTWRIASTQVTLIIEMKPAQDKSTEK
jgi:uncharacterized protein (TIGR02246 family)